MAPQRGTIRLASFSSRRHVSTSGGLHEAVKTAVTGRRPHRQTAPLRGIAVCARFSLNRAPRYVENSHVPFVPAFQRILARDRANDFVYI